jgi:hypothetical protein
MQIKPIIKIIKEKVYVEVDKEISDGVTLTLTEEEALYLFHNIAQSCPTVVLQNIRDNIEVYPESNYLLADLDAYSVSKVLTKPIYDGLKQILFLTRN